jgi:ParB family chromosome partitioning protein
MFSMIAISRTSVSSNSHTLPVVVREFDDTEVLEIAIIENIQRTDLNPVEEALGYRQLMDKFGHTQEKMAEALGKSRSHIANILRLLQLPDAVLSMVEKGDLSSGHARALITASDPLTLAKDIVKKGLSVRATEALVRKASAPEQKSSKAAPSVEKDADSKALENDLMAALGMKVSLSHAPGQEHGQITLFYKSLEQLDDLCRKLSSD